jgi:hypothetical protein
MGDGSSHHYKDLSERGKKQEMVLPVYQGSGFKLLRDGSSNHYKDPPKGGNKQEMVAPVYQGSGVKGTVA